eukprot:scaffold10.g2270.t1
MQSASYEWREEVPVEGEPQSARQRKKQELAAVLQVLRMRLSQGEEALLAAAAEPPACPSSELHPAPKRARLGSAAPPDGAAAPAAAGDADGAEYYTPTQLRALAGPRALAPGTGGDAPSTGVPRGGASALPGSSAHKHSTRNAALTAGVLSAPRSAAGSDGGGSGGGSQSRCSSALAHPASTPASSPAQMNLQQRQPQQAPAFTPAPAATQAGAHKPSSKRWKAQPKLMKQLQRGAGRGSQQTQLTHGSGRSRLQFTSTAALPPAAASVAATVAAAAERPAARPTSPSLAQQQQQQQQSQHPSQQLPIQRPKDLPSLQQQPFRHEFGSEPPLVYTMDPQVPPASLPSLLPHREQPTAAALPRMPPLQQQQQTGERHTEKQQTEEQQAEQQHQEQVEERAADQQRQVEEQQAEEQQAEEQQEQEQQQGGLPDSVLRWTPGPTPTCIREALALSDVPTGWTGGITQLLAQATQTEAGQAESMPQPEGGAPSPLEARGGWAEQGAGGSAVPPPQDHRHEQQQVPGGLQIGCAGAAAVPSPAAVGTAAPAVVHMVAETPLAVLPPDSLSPGLLLQQGGGGSPAPTPVMPRARLQQQLFVAETPAEAAPPEMELPLPLLGQGQGQGHEAHEAPPSPAVLPASPSGKVAEPAVEEPAAPAAPVSPALEAAAPLPQQFRGLAMQLSAPVLLASASTDGHHLALLLSSHSLPGEPSEVLVLRLRRQPPPDAQPPAAGPDDHGDRAAQGQGGQPGAGTAAGVEVLQSIDVQRTQWGEDGQPLGPNCMQLAVTARRACRHSRCCVALVLGFCWPTLLRAASLAAASRPPPHPIPPGANSRMAPPLPLPRRSRGDPVLILSAMLAPASSQPSSQPAVSVLTWRDGGGAVLGATSPAAPLQQQPPSLVSVECRQPLTCVLVVPGTTELLAAGDGGVVRSLLFGPLWDSYSWGSELGTAEYGGQELADICQLYLLPPEPGQSPQQGEAGPGAQQQAAGAPGQVPAEPAGGGGPPAALALLQRRAGGSGPRSLLRRGRGAAVTTRRPRPRPRQLLAGLSTDGSVAVWELASGRSLTARMHLEYELQSLWHVDGLFRPPAQDGSSATAADAAPAGGAGPRLPCSGLGSRPLVFVCLARQRRTGRRLMAAAIVASSSLAVVPLGLDGAGQEQQHHEKEQPQACVLFGRRALVATAAGELQSWDVLTAEDEAELSAWGGGACEQPRSRLTSLLLVPAGGGGSCAPGAGDPGMLVLTSDGGACTVLDAGLLL